MEIGKYIIIIKKEVDNKFNNKDLKYKRTFESAI
jgi:hypothetical protein